MKKNGMCAVKSMAVTAVFLLSLSGISEGAQVNKAKRNLTQKSVSQKKEKAVKASMRKVQEEKAEELSYKEKKIFLGFDLGVFVPLEKLGDMVGPQASGRVFFQYQDIAWWFGLGADAGFTQLADKTYDGNISFLYFIAHPFITFPLGKGFDLQVLFGAGVVVVMAELNGRYTDINELSGDPIIDAGMNVTYTFMGRYAIGIETKYYHIFENRYYNGIEVSAFFGIRF